MEDRGLLGVACVHSARSGPHVHSLEFCSISWWWGLLKNLWVPHCFPDFCQWLLVIYVYKLLGMTRKKLRRDGRETKKSPPLKKKYLGN